MISMWSLYLLNVLFSLYNFAIVSALVSGFIVFLVFCWRNLLDEDFITSQCAVPLLRPATIVCIVSCLACVLIPSKKEAAAIYIIPKIVNNEQVQQLPDNAINYLNIIFKKEIEEITSGGSK